MILRNGMRVRATIPVGYNTDAGEEGIVLDINTDVFTACVEFNRFINGHSGASSKPGGKPGYCWWVNLNDLIPLEADTNEGAIAFLREGL